MSWEGYQENICEEGHYWTSDPKSDPDPRCLTCHKKAIKTNIIDLTNGCMDRFGNAAKDDHSNCIVCTSIWRKELINPEERKYCECCGMPLRGFIPRYKIL